tara:strand:- start:96 stop:224 length:129 start_codon:yes stop_codon:yes gene_type:complete
MKETNTQNDIKEFFSQCQDDEDRGFLPKGHTAQMRNIMGVAQ